MAQKLTPSHVREIAAARHQTLAGFTQGDRISPHIARSEGFVESLGGAWGPDVYAFFEQMEDKDPHLFSILQTRKNGVLARPRKVAPASPDQRDVEIAQWMKDVIANLPDWDRILGHMLDSLSKGMAIAEIIWGFDAKGRVVPKEIKPRNAGRFGYDESGALRLEDRASVYTTVVERDGAAADGNSALRHIRSSRIGAGQGEPLPPRKFMVMTVGRSDDRPYGKGLCERVYWYWWFKKNNLKFWVMHNEKFGAPTVVAKHDPTVSPEERARLLEIISNLQADTGVTIPEGITLEFLEGDRSASSETFLHMAHWCNDEMTRAVLGQTLTVSEGQRGGSLALGRVHDAVRFDYIRSDSCLLTEAVNHQLVRWIIDFNFGLEAPMPRWSIDLSPEVDPGDEVAIDRQLIQMGVPLPLRYFYEKYGRPQVAEGDRQLRYDDTNLFQYHLQFGVLTVNEVRASLGLSPVDWGARPTSPAEVSSGPSPPTSSASEDFGSGAEGAESESEEEDEREKRGR